MGKKLKEYINSMRSKRAEEIAPSTYVAYDWESLKSDLNKCIVDGHESIILNTNNIKGLVDDYYRTCKGLNNLQLGFLLTIKRFDPISKEIIDKIAVLFDNDVNKTIMWFFLSNPELNHHTPCDLILTGREKEVLDHVNKKIIELTEYLD